LVLEDDMSDAGMTMGRMRSRKIDRTLFKILVAGTYPLFLVGVAVSRALHLGGGEGSIFAQALRTDEATIAIAFTG
jgi:hypothetical protein